MPTRSLGFQSFYQGQLTAAVSASDLTIPLDVLPTPSEGILVLESTSSTKREIIYYTSKTATAVVCPSGAGNGRGYDGTTAVSHLQNSTVIMAPVAQMFKSLQDGTSMSSTVTFDNVVTNTLSVGGQTPTADWSQLASAPNTVAANGNRSYTLTFNTVDYTGTMQPGTRVRTTRTVAAPTQCTSLNGTTQYYSRASASVAGMTFTDDFVVSAWVKLTTYQNCIVASRYNGTSGWYLYLNASGQVQLTGHNGGSGNASYVISYQSIPLNKWVHIAAQLDMSSFTATTTTSYVMLDGVDVPAVVARVGTNPTALVQAGNLEIGSYNGGTLPFPGKIAQVAIYSAKVTQATILASCNQTLAGTETSLISAYSFNNTINDLNTTNANNLTANGSAVATNADSPYGGQARGNISSTLDYGIVQSISFSTNTTAVVQVPEGNTIPTSGGVSALFYSSAKAPYGFPANAAKWRIISKYMATIGLGGVASTWYSGVTAGAGTFAFKLPIGEYNVTYSGELYSDVAGAVRAVHQTALSTSATTTATGYEEFLTKTEVGTLSANSFLTSSHIRSGTISNTAITTYYILALMSGVTGNFAWGGNASIPSLVYADNLYL